MIKYTEQNIALYERQVVAKEMLAARRNRKKAISWPAYIDLNASDIQINIHLHVAELTIAVLRAENLKWGGK